MSHNNDYKWWAQLGWASSVGILLVVCTGIGYLFGLWLDNKFGTHPWLQVIFTFVGVAAGFRELIRTAIRMSK